METDLEMGSNPRVVQSMDACMVEGGDQYCAVPFWEQKVCDAVLNNDWTSIEAAMTEFGKNEVFALRLNKEGLTPLMMAMSTIKTRPDFIMNLIENMSPGLLQLTDYRGNTALHLWDRRQNNQTENEKHVAQHLLQKSPPLRYFQNVDGDIPQLEGVDMPSLSILGDLAEDWRQVRGAIEKGNWNTIKDSFAQNKTKFAIRLVGSQSTTPLQYAIKQGVHVSHVNEMIDLIPKELLALTDVKGTSVLHLMANIRDPGYLKLAEKIVEKNPDVLCFVDNSNDSAIQVAIQGLNRPMVYCLLRAAMNKNEWPWNPLSDDGIGYEIYKDLIDAEFYDLAEKLLCFNNDIVLGYNCLDRLLKGLLYYEHFSSSPSPTGYTKSLQDSASTKKRARLLVVRICRIVTENCSVDNVGKAFHEAFVLAAQNGLTDIVVEILNVYGPALEFTDGKGHSAFQLAVMYRYPELFKALFNYACRSGNYKTLRTLLRLEEPDTRKNILHLAAEKPCQRPLNILGSSGPLLQLSSEISWFEELEKLLPFQERVKPNSDGKIPIQCFVENHSDMVEQETEMVTRAAEACLTAATLIVSIAFASSIQIPGGTAGDDGHAAYGKKTAFSLFGAANALALFFSITSVLSILSVFISRFDRENFMIDMPSKLIRGLIAMFISITSLMIAFAITLFLVFAKENPMFLGPLILFAAVPVIVYAVRQMPPFFNILKSTYAGFRLPPIND